MTDLGSESLEILPLFPLANVVLFPRVCVPLYIFEPRYRQMTEAVLRTGGRIGMVVVIPDQIDTSEENPAVFPVGCAGQVQSHQQRPDGTYDLLLEGIFRFRIQREVDRPTDQLYREATVTILADDESDSPIREVERVRAQVHQSYGTMLGRVAPDYLEQFKSRDFSAMPHAVYANTISVSLTIDAVEKQSLLESASTLIRLKRLLAVIEFKLAEPLARGGSNPSSIQ